MKLLFPSAFAALFALPAAASQSSFQIQGLGSPIAASGDATRVVIFDGSEYLLWDASGPVISLETPDVDHVQVCGISADGSTVLGRAEFLNSGSNIVRTARWSEQDGWQDLGDTLLTPSGPVPASGGLTHHASSDGSRIVGGTRLDSGLLRPFVWTAATGMVELEGGSGSAFRISDDGQRVTGQTEFVQRIWDESGQIVHSFPTPPGSFANLSAGAFSSGGDHLAGRGSTIGGFVWSAVTGVMDVGDFNACCPVTSPVGSIGLSLGGQMSAVSSSGRLAVGNWAWEPAIFELERFATVWTPGGGVRRLDEALALTGADVADFNLEYANLMSSNGEVIIGMAANTAGGPGGWFTAHLDQEIGQPFCPNVFDNSTGHPGQLSAQGSTTLSELNLTLEATSLPPNRFAFAISSMQFGGAGGPPLGPSICVSGGVGVHRETVRNSGAAGAVSIPIDLTAIPVLGGQAVPVMAGQTWGFQVWHRDEFIPITGMSNTTPGVSVQFR